MTWMRKAESKWLPNRAATLREARVPMRVEAHRERRLAIKRGELSWTDVDTWRKDLHRDFERALAETNLPERPDYETAIRFLIKAMRETAQRLVSTPERTWTRV